MCVEHEKSMDSKKIDDALSLIVRNVSSFIKLCRNDQSRVRTKSLNIAARTVVAVDIVYSRLPAAERGSSCLRSTACVNGMRQWTRKPRHERIYILVFSRPC